MPATSSPPESARQHYLLAALLAQRAVEQASKAKGLPAAAEAVFRHQVAAAVIAEQAVADMLAEQGIRSTPEAKLVPTAFTADASVFADMADKAQNFDRLVESLVQDAARAAESVSTAVRKNIWHVRFVTPPCCARCAVLSGRIYRYSDGFLRHPNCDCVMIPTTVASPIRRNPDELFADGDIQGLSKADTQAIEDGADIGQVVNVRRKEAGLMQSGRVLKRGSRLTPEGIYRLTGDDRSKAVELLARAGYIT